jgi:hypothetical protein
MDQESGRSAGWIRRGDVMQYPTPLFSFLAFQLNKLLDDGEAISLEAVSTHLGDRSLLAWLDAEYPDFDVSLFRDRERRIVLDTFENL